MVIEMNVIESVLLDEKHRNLRMQEQYKKEIEELPKGKLTLKKRKSGEYFYLVYREGRKVKYKYVGKDATDIEKQIEKRKHLEELLKKLKKEYKQIKKVVK